jgi:hypothetical protein
MDDASDFRRIALSVPGAEESSRMGSPDFRVGAGYSLHSHRKIMAAET